MYMCFAIEISLPKLITAVMAQDGSQVWTAGRSLDVYVNTREEQKATGAAKVTQTHSVNL